jgi:hypothetical protein
MAQRNSSIIRSRKEAVEGSETASISSEIMWRIDWVFMDIDKTLSDTCVSETRSISDLLGRFFDDTWKLGATKHLFDISVIKSVSDLDVFLVSVTKEEIPMKTDVSLRESLNGQSFIEYPVFHIRSRQAIASE